MGFDTIQRSSAPEMVAEQILARIDSGELSPGSRLPAQRDLAAALGVGRSSVREAINALAVMGYLEVRHGSGTYIREVLPDGGNGLAGLDAALGAGSLLDLMEVRELLEGKSAALAAERAGPAQVRRLKKAVDGMQAAPAGYDGFLAADLTFHAELAAASDNPIIGEMMKLVTEKVLVQHGRLKTGRLSGDYRQISIDSARQVVACIESGDADGAAARMRAHLDAIRGELRKIVG